jgi:hypothetical protein
MGSATASASGGDELVVEIQMDLVERLEVEMLREEGRREIGRRRPRGCPGDCRFRL